MALKLILSLSLSLSLCVPPSLLPLIRRYVNGVVCIQGTKCRGAACVLKFMPTIIHEHKPENWMARLVCLGYGSWDLAGRL